MYSQLEREITKQMKVARLLKRRVRITTIQKLFEKRVLKLERVQPGLMPP